MRTEGVPRLPSSGEDGILHAVPTPDAQAGDRVPVLVDVPAYPWARGRTAESGEYQRGATTLIATTTATATLIPMATLFLRADLATQLGARVRGARPASAAGERHSVAPFVAEVSRVRWDLARLRVGGLGRSLRARSGTPALTEVSAFGVALPDGSVALDGDVVAASSSSLGGAHLSLLVLTPRFYHTPTWRAPTTQRAQASCKRDEIRAPSLHTPPFR